MNAGDGQDEYRRALDSLRLPAFAVRDPSRPFIVTLEGPNGAGKTTLCATLAQNLGALPCLGTDEAWFSDSFKTRMIRDAEWSASAMFFLSGCMEQMRSLRGRSTGLVVMDRCIWSTLAVHAADSAERLRILIEMLRPISANVQIPDLTLVLDADFNTCQSRINRKSGVDRMLDSLTANRAFHAREHAFYRWLASQRPEIRFISAADGPAQVFEAASKIIRETPGALSRSS
jgi:thymidylate kinase